MDYELEGSGRDAEVDSEVAAGIVASEAPIPLVIPRPPVVCACLSA